jgi:adenine-specific DNA-methyltransferase
MSKTSKIQDALDILTALQFPTAQRNERSALCLLALADLKPNGLWTKAKSPLIGITPMMAFAKEQYDRNYAPNTRETFRRQTMHQFVDAALALYNPDKPDRAVNSPSAVYQLSPEALALVRSFGSPGWRRGLKRYLSRNETLIAKYSKVRDLAQIPVVIKDSGSILLSAGEHSALIKAIIKEFAPRFTPGADLIYAGDTGDKFGFFNKELLEAQGIKVDTHGKMPDVVLHYGDRGWLVLVEAVTSHGPVDGKRRDELRRLFAEAKNGLVYVTAFPTRAVMSRYLSQVAWETEVWVADSPTHLIHFNGSRFLGPYDD